MINDCVICENTAHSISHMQVLSAVMDSCDLHVIDTNDGQDVPSHPYPLGSQALQGDSNHDEGS